MNEWILVVDDDANNLRAASHILVSNQMRASCVKSGEEALRFLNAGKHPDLILLDIHMYGMDGFETLRNIRDNPETNSVPVIFLTADEDSDTETKGLDAGAMDFIKKPFVPGVLLTRVRHIIDLTRLQNDLSALICQGEKRLTNVKNGNRGNLLPFSRLCASATGEFRHFSKFLLHSDDIWSIINMY